MRERCTVVKLNLQFHEESAIFAVDVMKAKGKTIIATAGGDKAIRLWEYTYTGEEPKECFEYKTVLTEGCSIIHIYTLNKHRGSVNSLQFSKDGKYLLSGGDTGAVYAWDMQSILESTPEEEDKKYTGQPIQVRGADSTDIYEVKWFQEKILVGVSSGRIEQYKLFNNPRNENTSKSTAESENTENLSVNTAGALEITGSTEVLKCDTLHMPEISQSTSEDHEIIPSSNNLAVQSSPKKASQTKGNSSLDKPHKSVKFRVLEEYVQDVFAKCISSKQAHKDIVQGIACTDEIFASVGNDRVLKVFNDSGKAIQKLCKKSLITDKHTFFFRRLSFSEDGLLYLPSATYEGINAVHILSPPEYKVIKTITPFPSPTICTVCTSEYLIVSEGRNVYIFTTKEYSLVFRIVDCSFLPITDIKPIQDDQDILSLIISSCDGFLTNVLLYKRLEA
ncbi:hypothetical protein NEIG_00256 [Nematocida sp. ERTm5]|nr:hypothetical protein NEIG_00256 [Nematocida sp. ERTm5]